MDDNGEIMVMLIDNDEMLWLDILLLMVEAYNKKTLELCKTQNIKLITV